VLWVDPETSVRDAALLMNEHKVGNLLVTSGEQVVGIVTERDILVRVVGPGPPRRPDRLPIGQAREILAGKEDVQIAAENRTRVPTRKGESSPEGGRIHLRNDLWLEIGHASPGR
jgi:CBS domain-containing protein